MRVSPCRWLVLLALALPQLTAAEASGTTVLAGPWMLLRDDGGVQIGVELNAAEGQAAAGTTATLCRGIAAVPATITTTTLTRPGLISRLVTAQLEPANAAPGSCSLNLGSTAVTITLPRRPGPQDTVRIAVAGGSNWPQSADLERMATALGGPLSAVVALDSGTAAAIGHGGWEATIPVIPLMGRSGDDTPLVTSVLGTARMWWASGASWGTLGLPVGDDLSSLRSALARDLDPWLVGVIRQAPWDPGLKANRECADPTALRSFVALGSHFTVPIMLTSGSGAGWISEPLATDSGRLVMRARGTRIIGGSPSGDGISALPDVITVDIPAPALVGLAATTQTLTAGVVTLGDDQPAAMLHYDLPAADLPPHGTGWGIAQLDTTLATWMAGGDKAAAALDDSSWAMHDAFDALHLSNEMAAKLIAAASTDPVALRLIRRFLTIDTLLINFVAPALDQLPPVVRRDLALRHLARPRPVDADTWSVVVTTGDDQRVLRAVLRAAEKASEPELLKLLQKRLRNQADGTLPLERDPLLQHRILCAVLDSPLLSPTPLREIALALRTKVDALNRGPIERFLARVGEKRPLP